MPILRKLPNSNRYVESNGSEPEARPVSFRTFAELMKTAKASPSSGAKTVTRESVQNHLDSVIRLWREKRDQSDDPAVIEMAAHYIDAYQSARSSLLGETLEGEDLDEAQWKKLGREDWKNMARRNKASQVVDWLTDHGIVSADAAEKKGKSDAERMKIARALGKSSMSTDTWAMVVSMMREKEAADPVPF